ncbi:hypothetical protein NYA9BBAC_02817 [Salinibacterium sp. NYA9b]
MKDLQSREQWFTNQRFSVGLVCPSVMPAETFLPARLLTEEVLSVGFQVGLFSASDAVRITLQRLAEGVTVSQREERRAFSFRDDAHEVEVELLDVTLHNFTQAARVCRFLIASSYREMWDQLDDPQESLQSFLITWQEGAADFGEYRSPEPRLSDTLRFDRTQRRTLASLDRALDSERSELLQRSAA